MPWLNAVIDNPLLENLKRRYGLSKIGQIYSIGDIDKRRYEELQKLIKTDIEHLFDGKIFPVQYDDMKWRELTGNKNQLTWIIHK